MTFVRNHLDQTWACDFFVVITASFRVLHVFVVLSLGRRRVVHFGVTENPSAAWTAQRLVEATIDADHIPRFLIHDRDSIYGGEFRARARGLGARRLPIPPRAPTGEFLLRTDDRHASPRLPGRITPAATRNPSTSRHQPPWPDR